MTLEYPFFYKKIYAGTKKIKQSFEQFSKKEIEHFSETFLKGLLVAYFTDPALAS